MRFVNVKIHINAPLAQVFAAISDHETFLVAGDGTHSKVIQEGKSEKNGLGCVRKLEAGKRAWYVEEITAWDRPTYFEYTIRSASLPIQHQGSRLSFAAANGGTDVEWSSRFRIPIPILGGLLGTRAAKLYTNAFTSFLTAAKDRLEREH
jgi:hypothetical protein